VEFETAVPHVTSELKALLRNSDERTAKVALVTRRDNTTMQ